MQNDIPTTKRVYKTKPPEERFIKYVKKADGCWSWTGGIDHDGYGIFTVKRGNSVHASKYSYIFHKGPVPEGMYVLHTCDNPECTNPEHLYLGTPKQNSADRDRRGRQCVGSRHPRSKLTEAQVLKIRELYVPKRGSMMTLAKAYGVDHAIISKIIKRTMWKHI